MLQRGGRSTKYKIPSTEHKPQRAKSRITKYEVQRYKYEVRTTEGQVWSSE